MSFYGWNPTRHAGATHNFSKNNFFFSDSIFPWWRQLFFFSHCSPQSLAICLGKLGDHSLPLPPTFRAEPCTSSSIESTCILLFSCLFGSTYNGGLNRKHKKTKGGTTLRRNFLFDSITYFILRPLSAAEGLLNLPFPRFFD